MLFGLSVQLATFTLFIVILALFCLRVQRGHGEGNELLRRDANVTDRDFGFNPLVKLVVRGMWIASVLVEVGAIQGGECNCRLC